jgi:hypothetical protein
VAPTPTSTCNRCPLGYGDLLQERPGRATVEWFVVGLARQKNYISLYVDATAGSRYLVADYAGKLGKAKVGSANVTFKRLADIDTDTMRDLVSRAHELWWSMEGGRSRGGQPSTFNCER